MNATRPKKNVAGYVDEQGRFRPIRSPQYIGSRKATAKDRRKYSPAKAGDLGKAKQERALEAPWDTELRIEREAAERKKRDQDRIMREIEGEAFGTGESRKKGYTLLQFVRSAGGIRRTFRHGGKKGVGKYGKRSSWDSGEIDRLSFKETGKRGLTTDQPNKGRTMDKMFQAARESGYDVTSIDDMMERIESEAAGSSPTYATHGSLSYNPAVRPDRLVPCRRCLAKVNIPCRTPRGKLMKGPSHAERQFDAQKVNPKDDLGFRVAFKNWLGEWESDVKFFKSKAAANRRKTELAKTKALNGHAHVFEVARNKKNPAGPDWGMRVCANCDKYTANADLKKLGEINVCKACHKKLTASKAAKSQASLFDDQGMLFNPGQTEKVLWARRKGAEKWQEEIITSTTDAAHLAKAKKWATDNGFIGLRVETLNLSTPPNFAGTVRRNPKAKNNPDGITMFAQLASGVASALQVREMLNRKPAAKKRKTTRRKNPTTVAKANPRKQVTVPARGDYYLLTIGSGDDIMAVYLQDGDKDGFSKRFKTVAAAKSYATKKRLRLKANPRMVKMNPGYIDTFFKEKNVPYASWTITDKNGEANFIDNETVIAFIKKTRGTERTKISNMLRRIDFANGNVNHFLRHLAEGLVNQRAKRNPVKKAAARKNPTRSVRGVAAKAGSDAYYLNPFMDGVYLSHGTTLGRKFATQTAARKFARDNKIRLSNPTRKAVAAKTRTKAVANPVARKRNVRLDRHGRQTVHTLTCAKCKRQEQAASMATLERRADRDQWLVGSGRNGSKTLCRDCRFQKPKKNNPTPKAPAKRVAKKNPTKPRSALYEKFQGRKPERLSKTLASEHAPQTLVQLGKLHEVKLMGVREAIKFNPSRVRLCAAHGKLWITGAKIDRPDPKQNPGTVHPIAEIDHVVYETWKPHHGDQPGQRYIHKLGEWSGNRPTLCVDREGYPVIKGGAYTIEDRGIVD